MCFSWVRRVALIALLALFGCTAQPLQSTQPQAPARLGLRLPPSSLGATIARQQHLKVERDGRIEELNAALEIDGDHLELVGLAFGQRVLTLSYDGKELQSWRHVMLPSQVRAEDVLEDLQLALWPKESISKALPSGWSIEDDGLRRTLYLNNQAITVIDYSTMPRWEGTTVLENLRFRYRLTIQSVPAGP